MFQDLLHSSKQKAKCKEKHYSENSDIKRLAFYMVTDHTSTKGHWSKGSLIRKVWTEIIFLSVYRLCILNKVLILVLGRSKYAIRTK